MSRRHSPRLPQGIQWTGENTGDITPIIVLGQAVFLAFNNFTADHIFIPEGLYPNLGDGKVDTSTSLTAITLPSLLGPANWSLKNITGQDNLTVNGPGGQTMLIYNCEYINVKLAVAELDGTVTFQNCTPVADLACTMPNTVTGFVMDNCQYTSVPALPAGVTTLSITNCANMSDGGLPDISGLAVLASLDISGSPVDEGAFGGDLSGFAALSAFKAAGCSLASLFPLPNTVVTLDYSGNGLTDQFADAPIPTSCKDFNASNCALSAADVDSILAALVANGRNDGTAVLDGSNAAPTAAGLASKATLVGRRWTVTNS